VDRVLERHPENDVALPMYLWLDTPRKLLHVEVARLDLRDEPAVSSS
jgi:hypothetical protein